MEGTYTVISPGQGIDGNWYVDANGGSDFSGSHLEFERERGNLRRVTRLRVLGEEEEIPDGSVVCFTAWGASLWAYVIEENKNP